MRRALAVLAFLLGGSALPACHTSQRLWRITPFEGGGESGRVNLWPLAYHAGEATSVLWPLFDVDTRGFALRPLVAREESAWSILYPFASFDTATVQGWIFPFYRFEGAAGLFPLANFGDLNWIGPAWWSDDARGLFPVARLGGTSYVGPVWWSGAGDEARSGLFPVARFGPTSYVGPAWWRTEGDAFGLLPLFGVDLFRSGIDHVGPLWWRGAGASSGWGLFPLYARRTGPDESAHDLLLGLGHVARSGERRERWLLPLGFDRAVPGKRDSVLLPLFWSRTRGASTDVYTLFGNRSVDPGRRTLNVYPLWWSHEDEHDGSAWRMLVPFFYFGRDEDERTLITPLGGRGWSASGAEAFVNVLGPLYHRSRSLRRDEERTAFLWPLYERHRRGAETRTRMVPFFSRTRAPGRAEGSYALWLGHGERSEEGRSRRFWPLWSWSDAAEVPDPLYDWTLYGKRVRPERETLRVFPFYAGETRPAGSSWDALLGLAHHEHEGEGPARTERTWLWPLWSRSRGTTAGGADHASVFGQASWEGGRHVQLGFSLLYSRRTEESAERERETSRALLCFTHEREERRVAPVPAARPTARENRVRHASRGFLFDAFVSRSSTYQAWREGLLAPEEAGALRAYALASPVAGLPDAAHVGAILAAHAAAPAGDDPAALRAAIADFAAANTRTVAERQVRLPLLWGYERTEDELAWRGPLGLVRYERDEQRTRFSLLYYGYRSETRAGRTSRDIFPFVTWDTGPGETRWSFLWRVLHYQQQDGKRGGHVLFLPWGDV